MSSDCYDARVKSVDGTEVVFDVLTGKAGGIDDCSTSRSFALLLLHDAMRRAGDSLWHIQDESARYAESTRLRSKGEASALSQALAEAEREVPDWFISVKWMSDNVGRFVKECTLVERRNDLGWDALSARESAIEEAFGGTLYTNQYHLWQPRRWNDCHNYTLRVVVTDPKWVEHLEPGVEFGTTAFDVWTET